MIQGVKYTRAGDARCIFISQTILHPIGCLCQHLASHWPQTLQNVCCPRAIFRQEYSPDLRVLILTDPDSGVASLSDGARAGERRGPGPLSADIGHNQAPGGSRGGAVAGDRAIKSIM